VKSVTPFSVEECSVGTGAACGSVYLDQGFESLLRKRFGKHADTVLTERRLKDLVRNFDISIKRVFNPFDVRCDTEFEISVTGVTDMKEIGLEDGYLTLTKLIFLGVRLILGMMFRVFSILFLSRFGFLSGIRWILFNELIERN
jgi:hypothetical protein